MPDNELGRVAKAFNKMADTLVGELKVKEGLIRKAQSANLAKSNFLAAIGHEIKTPMNSIIGNIDLALDTGQALPGDLNSYLAGAKAASIQLHAIIEDILDISRLETRHMVFKSHNFAYGRW